MANLTPVSRNDDVVMLELNDFVKGGPGGKSNEQAQQLLNKEAYLDTHIKSLISSYENTSAQGFHGVQTENNNLIRQIEILKGKSDVSDVVLTYADLLLYDTSTLYDNNIVKVLSDETHDNMCSYYRWHTSTQQFTYIGSEHRMMPIVITQNATVNPDDNYTYVIKNSAALTLGTSFIGCCVTVIGVGTYTININGTSGTYGSNGVDLFYYLGSGIGWIHEESKPLDAVYPVGSVYMSMVDSTPPLGGTWTRLDSGKLIRSTETVEKLLTEGGSDTQVITPDGTVGLTSLTTDMIPPHNHVFDTESECGNRSATHTHKYHRYSPKVGTSSGSVKQNVTGNPQDTSGTAKFMPQDVYLHTHTVTAYTNSLGSGTGHGHTITMGSITINVKQSYINVYMWRRTA